MTLALAVGFGFGIVTTLARLAGLQGWPPSLLITAMTNLPMQVCFALLIASPVLLARFPVELEPGERKGGVIGAGDAASARIATGWRVGSSYVLALTVQTAFQAVLETNALVGHWMAWLEPWLLGALWLGLILLVWLVGLAVMAVQERVDLPRSFVAKLRAGHASVLLSPYFWTVVGIVVAALAFLFLALTFSAGVESMLGRLMIYALMVVPLLASAVMLRTAFALRRRPAVEEE